MLVVIDLGLQFLAASAAKHILLLGMEKASIACSTVAGNRTACGVVLFVFAVFACSRMVQISVFSFTFLIRSPVEIFFFVRAGRHVFLARLLHCTSWERIATMRIANSNDNSGSVSAPPFVRSIVTDFAHFCQPPLWSAVQMICQFLRVGKFGIIFCGSLIHRIEEFGGGHLL